MRFPNLAILRDGVPQSVLAFVRLPDYMECRIGTLREPQQRLVVTRRGVGMLGKSIFIVPDDLPPIV